MPTVASRAAGDRSAERERGQNGRALEGKLALVTGAGSGIGAGIARGMAEAGARVIAVDINAETARASSEAIGGAGSYAADVSDRAACDQLASTVLREHGPISVLVNNAGIIRRGLVTPTDERWQAAPHASAGRQAHHRRAFATFVNQHPWTTGQSILGRRVRAERNQLIQRSLWIRGTRPIVDRVTPG